MSIGVDLVLSDCKPHLVTPDLQIRDGGIRGDSDAGAGLIGLRSLHLIERRMGAATKSPEKIELPAGRAAKRVLTLIAVKPRKVLGHIAQAAVEALGITRCRPPAAEGGGRSRRVPL